MHKYRLRFKKTGRAKYISHLDLMRTFQRAFSRASLPVQYSEGFNPHALISILLPLPLGMESVCELMDLRLAEYVAPDELVNRLNPVLPDGIEAAGAYLSDAKVKDVKWQRIGGIFIYDSRPPADMPGLLSDFFARKSIVITKKTKRGEAGLDIAPHIREAVFTFDGDGVGLCAVISAQEPSLRPDDLTKALQAHAPELFPDFCRFVRDGIFTADMRAFT